MGLTATKNDGREKRQDDVERRSRITFRESQLHCKLDIECLYLRSQDSSVRSHAQQHEIRRIRGELGCRKLVCYTGKGATSGVLMELLRVVGGLEGSGKISLNSRLVF